MVAGFVGLFAICLIVFVISFFVVKMKRVSQMVQTELNGGKPVAVGPQKSPWSSVNQVSLPIPVANGGNRGPMCYGFTLVGDSRRGSRVIGPSNMSLAGEQSPSRHTTSF